MRNLAKKKTTFLQDIPFISICFTIVAVSLNKALRNSSLKCEGGAAPTEAVWREIGGRQTN